MERKITYERLFNLGGYEHEKFVITEDLNGTNPDATFKDMCVTVLELESEIAKFRIAYKKLTELQQRLSWDCVNRNDKQKAEIKKEIRYWDQIVEEFKLIHSPRNKECKCFYCTHPEYDENNYED